MVKTHVIPLLLIALHLLGCERIETIETAYPNFQAAVEAKAIGTGKWIPSFLPPSATNIREAHNLDTNEIWLFFHLNPVDLVAVVSSCKQIIGREIVRPRKSPGSWWPKVLTQHFESPQQKVNNSYEYYLCTPRSAMAIDRNRNTVYFWDSGQE